MCTKVHDPCAHGSLRSCVLRYMTHVDGSLRAHVVHTVGDTYVTTPNLPVSPHFSPLPYTHTHTHTHTHTRTQVLTKAVYGMLPHNNLRKKRMRRLHLYPDEVNPSRTFSTILFYIILYYTLPWLYSQPLTPCLQYSILQGVRGWE